MRTTIDPSTACRTRRARRRGGAGARAAFRQAAHPPDVAKPARFLRGKCFSTHQSSETIVDTLSTIDRHHEFCAGARFRYESTFLNAALDELQQDVRGGSPVCGRRGG